MKRITLSALLMTLFLLLSCGSGSSKTEDPQNKFLKSLISLSNDFLNVFTSFSNMVGGVLGFDTNTKKSDVGNYFKKIQETVQGTKDKLEKIVSDMKSENNPNAEATDTAVKALITNTLDKIIQGAKTASEAIGDAGESIGDVVKGGAAGVGTKAEEASVKSLSEGIGTIVDVVLKNIGSADAGDDKKAEDGSTARGNDAGEAGKLFGNAAAASADAAKKSAADAVKAVGAVTGADILQAIVKDNGDAAKLAKNNGAANAINVNSKDGTISGGIALRAMAKDGKFANVNNGDADAEKAVKGAAVSAITKALDTLTIAIRNTIDIGLKTVKDAMKINPNDTPVTTDKQIPEIKN
ncbi:variable large family protein [Borrelia turicatae]|uniref:variable large family protein n=1 Tax=Borrelia turicatae TaxID=142 RepID=UPI003CCFE846